MTPLFNKKHYAKISGAVALLPSALRPPVVDTLAKVFEADNILFSKDRFEETCKIKKEEN